MNRRGFLRGALGALGALFVPRLPPAPAVLDLSELTYTGAMIKNLSIEWNVGGVAQWTVEWEER